ncbi:hypothetical protein PLICRDRAFT_448119 [Plicaturopsis crispa FD-325 SS-3]|uniref:Uncharacterized protein n=1 Tax=Plicaturopsis crispa FD-325 SS-3 TaxID=944288 RepID=A0A0C9SKF7_PLICR|nr:hypothetical protein PLICRDRAFT_448119 [Plicaturopsis crispa FD-325 SS-3]
MANHYPMPSRFHYIRFSLSPPCTDPLILRKTIQDAMTQTFGLLSSTYTDVLWIADDGSASVLRVDKGDAATVMAAAVAATNSPRLALVKESPFLPSLLSVDPVF